MIHQLYKNNLPSSEYIYPMTQSANLTNSINKMAYRTFNGWGGVTHSDILSNYPPKIIDLCWENLGRFVLENYLKGKGSNIKGFGTFTFTNVEFSLEGTTNQYARDIKRRRPLFLVSNEFIDYLKPGIFTPKSGLLYYTQNAVNNISIVKVNYAKISYGSNISKEECANIINTVIKNMADQIRRGVFTNKYLPKVGTFLHKAGVFGMRFENKVYNDTSLKSESLIQLKKNFRLCMESKDSSGVSHRDIRDIDYAERNVRPKISVITNIAPSADEFMQEAYDIDVKRDITDEPRDDLFFHRPVVKNQYFVDQRYYRKFPKHDIFGLKIPIDILESIVHNKSLLLRNMKNIDRHGDGLIPKYDFINAFHNTNVHKNLRIELIIDMVNKYLNDDNIIMVNYVNLLNTICSDLKNIINREYTFFPIEKYLRTIPPNNRRSVSQNCYCMNNGNLEDTAISSTKSYKRLPSMTLDNDNNNELKEDLKRIQRVSMLLYKKKNNMISYLELLDLLEKNNVFIDKVQIIKILKYLNINNPNAFFLGDFISSLNRAMFGNDRNLRLDNVRYDDRGHLPFSMSASNFNKKTINFDYEFQLKALKIIKDRIFKESEKIDKISEYFDKLLSYNICRRANIIYKDEFERLLQLEKYDFTVEEINKIFTFFDLKNQGFFDRMDFIKALRNIKHPIETIQNYVKSHNLNIIDIAYKLGYDFYNVSKKTIKATNLNLLAFSVKVKTLNDNFDKDFINSLFNSIAEKQKNIYNNNIKELFVNAYKFLEILDIKKELDKLDLFQANFKESIENEVNTRLPTLITFNDLKAKFIEIDRKFTRKVPSSDFIRIIKEILDSSITEESIMHYVRMNKHLYYDVNNRPFINYHDFMMNIYIKGKGDKFLTMVGSLSKFISDQCNGDLFIFFAKMNNIKNSSAMDKFLNAKKLVEFFKGRVDDVDINTVMKIDFNGDGIISMSDVRMTIEKYYDNNFFKRKINI